MASRYVGVIIRHLAPQRPVTMEILVPPDWMRESATSGEIADELNEKFNAVVAQFKENNPDMQDALYYLDVRPVRE